MVLFSFTKLLNHMKLRDFIIEAQTNPKDIYEIRQGVAHKVLLEVGE